MEKSGQGASYPQIIDRPELRSAIRNVVENSITLLLWIAWISWVLPAVFTLWQLRGIEVVADSRFEALSMGAAVVLLILSGVMLWIYYNRAMIIRRHGERRVQPRRCAAAALARHFDVNSDWIDSLKDCRRIQVCLSDGRLSPSTDDRACLQAGVNKI
ncbi:MAG: poly-beta-1,6-N-acetyl-D-glucosamine biosynthesis protein PgaD [Elusimicrobia bacterium RIFOXYA2_FULL_50_26]|nr:MAG: poly-beta-1,6-N-acetyl-D-glucosamine biosynthesis protein PgaD [Elusimicrobia bacterium RIFOXYA2_FULL_50_26]